MNFIWWVNYFLLHCMIREKVIIWPFEQNELLKQEFSFDLPWPWSDKFARWAPLVTLIPWETWNRFVYRTNWPSSLININLLCKLANSNQFKQLESDCNLLFWIIHELIVFVDLSRKRFKQKWVSAKKYFNICSSKLKVTSNAHDSSTLLSKSTLFTYQIDNNGKTKCYIIFP